METTSSWSMVCPFTVSSQCLFRRLTRIFKIATGNFVPSPSSLLRSLRYPKSSTIAPVPSLSTNPFSLNPFVFALSVLATDFWVAVCVSPLPEGGCNVGANENQMAETNSAPLIYCSLQSRFYLHSGSHILLLWRSPRFCSRLRRIEGCQVGRWRPF